MHTLGFSFLILSLVLSSFHGKLANAQDFDLESGELVQNEFISLKRASVVDGNLSLNASTGDAQAFYSKPINFLDRSGSLHSFSTFFTFSSNLTGGNGTIAFVLTPDARGTVSLETARKTLTVEFNTSCSGNGSDFYGGNWGPGHGRGHGGNWGPGNGGGFFGGLGGFQVIEYANYTPVASQQQGGYGPNWNEQLGYGGPLFCNQQPPSVDPSNPTFQYQVVVEYNASTQTLWVGSPSCGDNLARTTQFASQNLSSIINNVVYVGFVVSGGGIYSISQWNLTSNATTDSVTSLALLTGTSTTTGSGSGSGSSSGSGFGGRHSDGGLSKGYVIGFSILGAAIGIGAAFLVCCLCMRRKRAKSTRFAAAKSVHAGVIPESAVVFDARKPNAPPVKVVLAERDTVPLNSAFQASTGGASWLHPVAPR